MPTVHVVSHTHWDREWYLPAGRFRQRLVALVDELLDDPPDGGASFLLDGQTSVLSDYLAVRPERAGQLADLMQTGQIEAGPWFVLADELIPGGESLVRNLFAGRRMLDSVGAKAPPVLYCPDSFGHPADLPTLAAGFGFELIILLRGYGGTRWPEGDCVRWRSADGLSVLMYHFSNSGYETGANLPAGRDDAKRRWKEVESDVLARARLDHVLVMNGADHHARQLDLEQAIGELKQAAAPVPVRASSMTAFAIDLIDSAAERELPEVEGELRDSHGYVWTLQGTMASRAYQKRNYRQVERLLLRDVEPWDALVVFNGGASRKHLCNAAWEPLLLCQPHDTLCGCSTDEVARAMDARIEDCMSQAKGLRDDALADLIGHDAVRARTSPESWRPVAVVRNPTPRPREGVATVTLKSFVSNTKVGLHPEAPPVPPEAGALPGVDGFSCVQVLSRETKHDLIESPRHYPDCDLVTSYHVAAWVPEVAGYGVTCFPHGDGIPSIEPPNPASTDGSTITNGLVSLTIDSEGSISFADHGTDTAVADFLTWESATDLGDLYSPSIRGPALTTHFVSTGVVHDGPLRAAVRANWEFEGKGGRVEVSVVFSLDADSRFLRMAIAGNNSALDHRLRVKLATALDSPRTIAEGMFRTVERLPLEVTPEDARTETPLKTAPLHRYVSAFNSENSAGATLFSDGLAEYETGPVGELIVTLLRSVGELSRGDLPERAGHAGWPTPTPGAQCIGPFGAELAFMLHGGRTPREIDLIERTADDFLLPLSGETLRSALHLPAPSHGVELQGEGLAFRSCKEGETNGSLVLRCVNLLQFEVRGRWILGWDVAEAHLARIDETPTEALTPEGNAVPFKAGPAEVVTVLVGGSEGRRL